ncbi:Protein CBG27238 [Caenorhabditis briggsae]|uniref:Protein CBG27238 n=1 Tax=Caenorhabditis briggsae TaxID=6238 RepID=B6IFW0_CAEBR|nr:Protein CBG27238 [Caenorhabditis briggsae]CAR98776.1 Protein CBG27238 [Caenorhabditis briggsae]
MERYELDRYGLDMKMSPPESEDSDSDDYPSDVVSLQKLLATAIKKRRELSITEGENLFSSEDDENDDDEEPPAKRRSLGEDGKEVE